MASPYTMYCTDVSRLQRALINDATGNTLAVVAGVANKAIHVFFLDLALASSTTIEWKSNTTSLGGPQTMTAKVVDFQKLTNQQLVSIYDCAVGASLNLVPGSAVQISGFILYSQE